MFELLHTHAEAYIAMDAEGIPARKKVKMSSDLLKISGKGKL